VKSGLIIEGGCFLMGELYTLEGRESKDIRSVHYQTRIKVL